MPAFRHLLEAVVAEGAAALATVTRVEGSTPREAGAWMAVRPSGGFHGTIGGGALEWEVLRRAGEALRQGGKKPRSFSLPLGPGLGQCCGGRVEGSIEFFDESRLADLRSYAAAEADGASRILMKVGGDGHVSRRVVGPEISPERDEMAAGGEPATPLLLFGAGHVGRALVLALAGLPFRTRWIDSRRDAFPAAIPDNVSPVAPASPADEIPAAPRGAFILVMSHSHALDLEIVAAALAARRFPYVGLIGSATKRARFESRLRALGLDEDGMTRLVCPIGVAGIDGKTPAVIAASVVAQLLRRKCA